MCKGHFLKGDILNRLRHFFRGMARAVDIGGTIEIVPNDFFLSRNDNDPWGTDAKALRGDWQKVGIDINTSMNKFKEEHEQKLSGSAA
jgi:hypothetical protein